MKTTISYSDGTEERIQALIDAGVIDNRSEFFQRASQMYLYCLDEAGRAAYNAVLDADTLEEAVERLNTVNNATGPANDD